MSLPDSQSNFAKICLDTEVQALKRSDTEVGGVILNPPTHERYTARYFCWTDFKPDTVELRYADAMKEFADEIRYMVFQYELCPTTGTKHAQCYGEFKNAIRGTKLQMMIGGKVHVAIRRGTREQARLYCMDEFFEDSFTNRAKGLVGKRKRLIGTEPIEYGSLETNQGQRTDQKKLAKKICDGARWSDLVADHSNDIIRYPRGIGKLMQVVASMDTKDRDVKVMVYYGKTKKYKSMRAWLNRDAACVAFHGGNWWVPYYDQNQRLIINEFNGQMSIEDFLQVTDRYPYDLPVKGGYEKAKYTEVVITSNFHPRRWWKGITEVQYEALMRRFTTVIDCDNEEKSMIHVPYEANVVGGSAPIPPKGDTISNASRKRKRVTIEINVHEMD